MLLSREWDSASAAGAGNRSEASLRGLPAAKGLQAKGVTGPLNGHIITWKTGLPVIGMPCWLLFFLKTREDQNLLGILLACSPNFFCSLRESSVHHPLVFCPNPLLSPPERWLATRCFQIQLPLCGPPPCVSLPTWEPEIQSTPPAGKAITTGHGTNLCFHPINWVKMVSTVKRPFLTQL